MSQIGLSIKNSNINPYKEQATDKVKHSLKLDKWDEKKKRNFNISKAYLDAKLEKKFLRVSTCANVLQFQQNQHGQKLAYAWFCKVRLCPMCSWRRSIKIANQNKQIVSIANQREPLRWIFLTLTTGKTVESKHLKNRIEHSMHSFNRFMKYNKIQKVVRGYFRGLEITKSKNKYHPHFHVLLAVKPSYFGGSYITKMQWGELWKKALKSNESVIVDIRTVKANKKYQQLSENAVQAFEAALLEVSKYPVKDTEFVKGNRQENAVTVYTMDYALSNKRLIGYGGLLKQIRTELYFSHTEKKNTGILSLSDQDSTDPAAQQIEKITAYWHYGFRQYIVKNLI
ncbi:protein rep [Bacillus thuringiensis]|uniref:protein rep n=1 Tax=Bacillus thuringiensis TaxID=1428 RepID=UPI003B98395E